MDFNKLLEKQIHKYLPNDFSGDERVMRFIRAVNNSYNAFEKDQALSAHAFRISEQEYAQVNDKLKQEIDIKKIGIKNLKEAIKTIGEEGEDVASINAEEDNLIDTLAFLKEQILRRKKMEAELHEYEHRFKMAFEKLGDNVWQRDLQTERTYFSNTESHFLGSLLKDFENNSALWLDNILEEDRWIVMRMDERYKTGEIDHHSLEYRMTHKDGSIRWVLDRGVVIEKNTEELPLKVLGTHTDITHIKQTEVELEQRVKQFQSLSENIPGVIIEYEFRKDGTQGLRYVSPAMERIFGIRAEDFYNFHKYIHPDDVAGIVGEIAQSKRTLAPYYNESRLVVPGKPLVWCSVSSSFSYFTENGSTVFTGLLLDITMQKSLEIDLISARTQAEESSRAKELFLANMSHEIRTPMNGILGMSRQLRKTSLDTKQRMYLDTINSAGEHLLVVINDILDISKIEAGELTLEKIGFRLKEVVARATSVMRQRAEEKGLELSYFIDDEIYSILTGDPYRLSQVLLNLLSNAVKFTEKGSVTIDCRVVEGHEEREQRQVVCIKVRDTGVGMDEEYLLHLYQKFSQEDRSVARQYGGTGLGMSISKQLAELMGGRISVESRKGIGTEVTLLIPFTQGTENDLLKKSEIITDSSILKDRKILLVEDNAMNRLVATTVLNSYGMLVSEANNGAEALAMLRDGRYDLILMDEQMPVMDGFESARIIRRDIDKDIPIIAITANAIKGEDERCKAAGMNNFISKPFDEDDLIIMIAAYLKKESRGGSPGESSGPNVARKTMRLEASAGAKRQERPEAVDNSDVTAIQENVAPLFSLRQLQTIGQGDDAFVQKMVSLFLDQMPLAAREMKEAYYRQNFALVKSIAHQIKPILDNLEIAGQREGIREIEKLTAMNCPSPLLEERIISLEAIVGEVALALKAAILP